MTHPTIQSTIHTPRLTLILLTDTSPGSQHVQWFHENWTDPIATAWSLHGPCKSLDESRKWMIEHRTKYDNLFYAVFATPSNESGDGNEQKGLGEHVGSVSLRRQLDGPTLPPPKTFDTSEISSTPDRNLAIDLRVIGYALFASAWGKGYATEACKAMLDAYASSIAADKAKGERVFYLEAGVDVDNPGSQAVLRKLGFREVGWKEETEKAFLNGAWRDLGYWVWGKYV